MPFFKEVTYVSTFKGLLQRDEQEKDRKQQNNRILERYFGRSLTSPYNGITEKPPVKIVALNKHNILNRT